MKIAICGKMCSGKTTLANHIMRTFPGYQKYSLAKKVKDLCIELFDMKHKDRDLLINFANKMRDIDPNVWINYMLKETNGKENCIIDDVRYQNEIDALINDGWKIIQLHISTTIQKNRIIKTYPDTYTEHIDKITHVSENNKFVFPENYPNLSLHITNDNEQQILHEIHLLITKYQV
jgi:cytidylate kinase